LSGLFETLVQETRYT